MPLDPYFTSSYRGRDKLTPDALELWRNFDNLPASERGRKIHELMARKSQGESLSESDKLIMAHGMFMSQIKNRQRRRKIYRFSCTLDPVVKGYNTVK